MIKEHPKIKPVDKLSEKAAKIEEILEGTNYMIAFQILNAVQMGLLFDWLNHDDV